MGKPKKLFAEFPPVSRQQWEDKITEDLKGAPYEKLITRTPEGIDIKPYYHSDDLNGLEYLDALPGKFPFTRSGKIQLNDWEIRQDIYVESITESNKKALHALNWGATALGFIIPDDIDLTQEKFDLLLEGIFFECIHINFITHTHSHKILKYLLASLKERGIEGNRIIGSVSGDPLGYFCEKGYFQGKMDQEFKMLAELIKESGSVMPFFKTIPVNAALIHNAGGSAVQELGFALASFSEYLTKLTEEGLNPDEIAPFFQLNLATGSSYFMEIAKIRAARLLFANLTKAWGTKIERANRIYIHSTTSGWNQTLYDPYVNMLRGTTESMSAALGGADSITVLPFDSPFRKTTKFSERIARNTQVILKEEAHLNKVVDPAGGSYYIEKLTDSIADQAWKLFLEIEEQGGLIMSLQSGLLQEKVKETARKRDMNIATRREVLLGTNQYPNNTEKVHEDYTPEIAFPGERKSGKEEIEKFKKYRGAMAFEDLRLKVEKSGKTPVVFMLTYGNLNWRKARAGFASGFFACAGYNIVDNLGFDSVEEGMKAANNANADIIVLCSSDEEYLEMARKAKNENKSDSILVVAGYPKESLEEIKKEGIEHFIHVKSNVLEDLKSINTALGIN
jgi:methylmalonyl-CoA mutase